MLTTRGLDLTNLDVVTTDEVTRFRDSYVATHGEMLGAYDFWLKHNPRVVKSHRLQLVNSSSPDGRRHSLPGTLGYVYMYIVTAYKFGIRYEAEHARSHGATKRSVLQMAELAFLRSGPRGMDCARSALDGLLDGWEDDDADMSALFPANWHVDPDFLRLPLDLGTDTLSEAELDSIRGWHRRVVGEVPGYVTLLATARPGLLKAQLDRWGRAGRGPLPVQMNAFVELQLDVARSDRAGVRDSVRLGRGLGMTEDQLHEAIGWGLVYGGPASASMVQEVLEGEAKRSGPPAREP